MPVNSPEPTELELSCMGGGQANNVSPAAYEPHINTAPHKQKGKEQQGATTREQRRACLPPLMLKTWGSQDTAPFHSTGSLTNAFQFNVSANRKSKAFV